MNLVGKQMVDFKNDMGEQVKGIKLHFICPDDRVFGQAAMTQFFNAGHALYDLAATMPLGEFDFAYGPRGRVVDIRLVEAPASEKSGTSKQ